MYDHGCHLAYLSGHLLSSIFLHNLSYFDFCLSRVLKCLDSLFSFINRVHPSILSLSSTSFSCSIHVSDWIFNMAMVLFTNLTLSFSRAFSAFLMIWWPLGVLIELLSLILTGKVGEIRFTKVKQRQLNKYNILLNRKEGNIKRANAITPTNSNNLAFQAGRQASALLPPGEGSNLSQAGRQAVTLLPPGDGSNLSQAGSQVGALLPSREGTVLPRQLLIFPQGKEAILLSILPRKEAVSPRQLPTFLRGKEAIYLRQAGRQVPSFPIGKETVLPRPLLTFLLGKEAVSPSQLHSFLQGKEVILCQQLLTFLLGKVTVLPRQPLILPWVIPKQVKQAIKLGQAGRASGILPGIGHSRLPRRIALPPRQTVLPPGKTTPPLPSPVGFPKGLLMKNLTLSGSLTYQANL